MKEEKKVWKCVSMQRTVRKIVNKTQAAHKSSFRLNCKRQTFFLESIESVSVDKSKKIRPIFSLNEQ